MSRNGTGTYTRTKYAEYLASEDWRERRRHLLAELDECGECHVPRWIAVIAYDQDLHVIHKHFNSLGFENPNDVRVLCARCHQEEMQGGKSSLHRLTVRKCVECGGPNWNPINEPTSEQSICPGCERNIFSPLDWWFSRELLKGFSNPREWREEHTDPVPLWEWMLREICIVAPVDEVLTALARIEDEQKGREVRK